MIRLEKTTKTVDSFFITQNGSWKKQNKGRPIASKIMIRHITKSTITPLDNAPRELEVAPKNKSIFPTNNSKDVNPSVKSTTFFTASISGVLCRPLDDPIRIDLPVYDQPEIASNAYTLQPFEPENHPGENLKSSDSAPKNLKPNINTKIYYDGDSSLQDENHTVGLFGAPNKKINSAILETEGYGSKVLSVKETAQNVVAGLLQPKPIVDTIREEEKYGNSGDKFYSAGRAVVGGAEKFSNLLNSILEIPGAIIKSITRTATEKLNNLGNKIVGL
ncbi:unnamed protein product [Danaus chrysippus]|uniref:(African queen) hypothetical protein n=1 Tax=Danaus chrysippus TaxID=151541 RepID=A0A8J2MI63_9NEOP|nr:unnamed protein product [Danaus chrysippus]